MPDGIVSGGEGAVRTWRVATTAAGAASRRGDVDNHGEESKSPDESYPSQERATVSCIAEAQLSADATCILTTDYSRTLSVYPFASPLHDGEQEQTLSPYAHLPSSDPIWAFTLNPHFDLNNSITTTVLVSRRDQYIGLHNALWDLSNRQESPTGHAHTGPVDISSKLVSYRLVDKLTEAVTAPVSLAWSPCGAYFYAGHRNQIAIFDLTSPQDPVTKIRTIPSTRNKLKGGGWGFKGDVSALAPSRDHGRVLAAGTRTRYVGLYDVVSSREITHLALPAMMDGDVAGNDRSMRVAGQGVTQLKWSSDGTYLYVAERASDALLIYDVRNFSLALAHCVGRKALTRQKMGFDLWAPEHGSASGAKDEVWAGGTDGCVRVWRSPCAREGAVEADQVLEVGEDPASSVLVHPHGNAAVVATGQYQVGVDGGSKGTVRGDVKNPMYSEWGSLNIFGLASY